MRFLLCRVLEDNVDWLWREATRFFDLNEINFIENHYLYLLINGALFSQVCMRNSLTVKTEKLEEEQVRR